eukprot:GFUD01002290.1.p1 GENE.GFUD01002290.1~~GFUD01002290.1.p1  ORF type:complete len:761 (-),score=175.26 GFUD01002290.1:178-2460(-)
MSLESLRANDSISNMKAGATDKDNITATRSLPEPSDVFPLMYEFQTIIIYPDVPLFFSGIDVKIQGKTSEVLRIRRCQEEDYIEYADSLKEEGLCPSSPIIQIEDLDSFLADSCKEIHIRHNVYEWEKYKKCHLRSYSNLQNSLSYIDIEAEMFEDYIKVCGHTAVNAKGEKKEQGSSSGSSNQQQRNNRSGNSSNDEGYGQYDGSPKQTMRSLVHVAKPEDICDVKLYFSREKSENRCPAPHEISVYAVIDKKAKITEFIEKELPDCGREQAAERIRVAIYHDQIYTPILGESTKENPKMLWEESVTFGSFSYHMLNHKRGFIKIQKMPPPLVLFCDRRKYSMLKLTTNSKGKPPEDLIYNHGANIVPTSCQKFHNRDKLPDHYDPLGVSFLPSASLPTSHVLPTLMTSAPYEAPISTIELTLMAVDDQPPQPSNGFKEINPREIISQKEKGDSSGGETIRICAKEPPRKRRKKDEIGAGDFDCPGCQKTLTRKQTLQDHIKKFHPQHAYGIPEVSRKNKGKGKKTSAQSTLSLDAESSDKNQQVEQQANYSNLQGNLWQYAQPQPSSIYSHIDAQGIEGKQGANEIQKDETLQGMKAMQVQVMPESKEMQGTNGTNGLQMCVERQEIEGMQGNQQISGIHGSIHRKETEGMQGMQETERMQESIVRHRSEGMHGTQETNGTHVSIERQETQGIQGIQQVNGMQGIEGSQENKGMQGIQQILEPYGMSDKDIMLELSQSQVIGCQSTTVFQDIFAYDNY